LEKKRTPRRGVPEYSSVAPGETARAERAVEEKEEAVAG
jgi:hypothetical protein